MSEKRAYNLRSGGSEAVTVPVQFEVSDENFMLRLLQCQQNTSQSGQVSDSHSGSENNSNMSNTESDNEENQDSKSTGVDKQVPSSSNAFRDQSTDTVSQQAINLQILSKIYRIFHGIRQGPATPFCYAEWSRLRSKITQIQRNF